MAVAASPAPVDERVAKIASTIRVILDFPKPGIEFQDITTLLLDPKAFKDTIDLFVERYQGKGISVVAGIPRFLVCFVERYQGKGISVVAGIHESTNLGFVFVDPSSHNLLLESI